MNPDRDLYPANSGRIPGLNRSHRDRTKAPKAIPKKRKEMFCKAVFRILAIFSGLFACSMLPAQENTQAPSYRKSFEDGNAFYAKNLFDSALDAYHAVLEAGYESWELYFNMGNAYYRKVDYPKAILYYEKALKLNPKQEDVKNNLALAELKITDRFESLPPFALSAAWQKFCGIFPMKAWAAFILVFALLILVCIVTYRTGQTYRSKRASFLGLVIVGLLWVLSFAAGGTSYKQFHKEQGIVMAESVALQDSPDAGSSSAITLHEGSKVSIEDKIEPYYQVRIKDGSKGWIPMSAIEMI